MQFYTTKIKYVFRHPVLQTNLQERYRTYTPYNTIYPLIPIPPTPHCPLPVKCSNRTHHCGRESLLNAPNPNPTPYSGHTMPPPTRVVPYTPSHPLYGSPPCTHPLHTNRCPERRRSCRIYRTHYRS